MIKNREAVGPDGLLVKLKREDSGVFDKTVQIDIGD